MPGWRSVLSFRAAFLARFSLDLFALISKLNIEHDVPSSYRSINSTPRTRRHVFVLALCHCEVSRWNRRCLLGLQ